MSSTELASISAANNREKMIDIMNELVVVSEVQEEKVDELFAKHKSIVDKTDKIQHDFEGLQANYLKKVSESTSLKTEEAKDAFIAVLMELCTEASATQKKIRDDFSKLEINFQTKVLEIASLKMKESKDAVVAELTSKLKQRDAELLEAEEKIKELNKLVRELSISN